MKGLQTAYLFLFLTIPPAVLGQQSGVPEADVLLRSGHEAYESREYAFADSFYTEAVEYCKQNQLDSALAGALIWQAWARIFQQDYQSARNSLDQASQTVDDCCAEYAMLRVDLLKTWEKYYSRTDAPLLLLEQTGEILRLLNEFSPHSLQEIADAHNRSGRAHFSLGQFEQALEAFQRAADLHPERPGEIAALNNMAAALRRLDRPAESLEVHRRLLGLRLERSAGQEDQHTSVSRYNIAAALFDLGEYTEAEEQVRSFINSYPEGQSSYRRNVAVGYRLLGDILLAGGFSGNSVEKSREAYLSGLTMYGVSGPDWKIYREAQEPEVVGLLSGLIRVFMQDELKANDEEVRTIARQGMALVDTIRLNYREAISRSFLAERVAPFYEIAMEAAVWWNEKELAWAIAERNKYLGLLSSITEETARLRSGLDPDVLSELESLESKLARNYRNIRRSRTSALERERFELLRQQDHLLDSIRKSSSQYSLLSRRLDFASPGFVAEHLQEDEVLILLFEGSKRLWSLALDNSGLSIGQSEWTDSDRKAMAGLLRAIRNREGLTRNWVENKQILGSSHALYEKVASPLSGSSPAKWIVIPDGSWNFLPMEALVTVPQPEDRKLNDYDWLCREVSIRYAPSATLMSRGKATVSLTRSALGIAPDYSADSRLSSLAAGPDEMTALARQFKADILDQEKASKASLLASLEEGQYGLIHFAMHAIADSLEPLDSRLAFPGSSGLDDSLDLMAWELYQLRIPVDLVVLGACESAWGPFQEGEGLYSLSRAFLHAGAKSVIGSLWLSADESSAEILEELYQKVGEGQTLDQALQGARFSQIEAEDELNAHPFFWSNYVLVGDNELPQLSPKAAIPKAFIILLLVPLFLASGGLIFRRLSA